jgi:nucleotide-binding universal stress UspA family protein
MKIVVTTDFSSNSKNGILFALQLASQTNCELIFYNVVQIFQPTIWDNTYYTVFEADELQRNQEFLERFISGIFLDENIKKQDYSCVCEIGISASSKIIEFANTNSADFICVSTVGGGSLMQLFGTTASELIAFSTRPVIIVPLNYSATPLANLFFASDFVNFEEEFYKIQAFSKLINATINIYHFDYQKVLDSDENQFELFNAHHKSEKVHFHLRKLDSGQPLLKQLENEIEDNNPSLVAVFTNQNRNWFDRLFLSSLSEELVFDAKTPMLVFKKHNAKT